MSMAATTSEPLPQEEPVEGRPRHERQLFGHPIGLSVLFMTEMWERFCYYGMRALLVLYVAQRLSQPGVAETVPGLLTLRALLAHGDKLNDVQFADLMYGWYTALVYLTPVAGGFLADRFIGQRRSVIVGAIIMAIGEFMLMKESLFLPALLILCIGVGFFKSNISTQVGGLYAKGDERRDRAFNVFYVGINVGATLSPLVCGTLGQSTDAAGNQHWAWGFGSAGVGMILGLLIYLWGQRYLAPDQIMKKAAGPAAPTKKFTRVEWTRITALIVLCALNISFWGVYEQQGNSLSFFTDSKVERHLLQGFGSAWEMPSSWYQSVNPLFIFALTLLINPLWSWLAKKGKDPSSAAKMIVGQFLLGIACIVLIGAGKVVDSGHKANFGWLVGATGVLTLGEIYLSPVGLSLVTKIAPPRIVSTMMGMWFLSSFFGDYLSGWLATYAETMSSAAFFSLLSAVSLVTGVVMIVLYLPLKKAIGDENETAAPA
jgi:POT family proton-dependent oligopeptide transporter